MIYKKFSGIILAGGKNSRIGLDKINIKLGEQTLLEITVNKLRSLFSEILIVTRKNQNISLQNVQIVEDIFPGSGSLGGLYSGLVHSSNKYSFVCACDMPFISPKVITCLVNKMKKVDVVVPKINGYFEPLCAGYSKLCTSTIKEQIKKNHLAIKDVLPEFHIQEVNEHELKKIDPNLSSFFNINTKSDFEKALEIYQ